MLSVSLKYVIKKRSYFEEYSVITVRSNNNQNFLPLNVYLWDKNVAKEMDLLYKYQNQELNIFHV